MGIRTTFSPMGGRSGLPGGGRAVEYIANLDGSSYIKSGIIASSSVEYHFKASAKSVNADKIVVGSRYGENRCWIDFEYLQNIIIGAGNYYRVIGFPHDLETPYTIDAHISSGDFWMHCDGTNIYKGTASFEMPGNEIYVFCGNNNGSPIAPLMGRIYWLKIAVDGVLVRDYVPAFVVGVACLYDKVTKSYFCNARTGAFTAGPYV